jgi:hypothetical protein
MTLPMDWVVPTGGDYFFAQSISAVTGILAAPDAPAPGVTG